MKYNLISTTFTECGAVEPCPHKHSCIKSKQKSDLARKALFLSPSLLPVRICGEIIGECWNNQSGAIDSITL